MAIRGMKKMLAEIERSVDERTENLSEEALACRRRGFHLWVERAQSLRRFNNLAAQGLMEEDKYCEGNCGATWRQVWDVRRNELVEEERRLPDEYKMPKGTGRMKRGDARAAYFLRKVRAYA